MAKILETWNDRKEENYQSFFDRYKTLPDYGALTSDLAHRATKNCEYIGLTVPSDKYSAQNLTPFYFALSKRVKATLVNDFSQHKEPKKCTMSLCQKTLYKWKLNVSRWK